MENDIERAFTTAMDEVQRVIDRDRANRASIAKLAQRLSELADEAFLWARTDDFDLEIDRYDDRDIYGHLSISPNGFYLNIREVLDDMIPSRWSQDRYGNPTYSAKAINDWPVQWLRIVLAGNHMLELTEALATRAKQQLASEPNEQRLPREVVLPVQDVAGVAEELEFRHVARIWRKAQGNLPTNPEDATSLAMSLVESVCKHILHAHGTEQTSFKLMDLWKQCVEVLGLRKTSTERVVSGLKTLVEGLRVPRNAESDAHGRGPNDVCIDPSDATLLITSAGAVALFLMEKHAKNSP